MLKQTLGVVMGTFVGIAAIKLLQNKAKDNEKSLLTIRNPKKSDEELKNFSDLLSEQLVVEYLSGDELAKWFREYSSLNNDKVNQIIAYPTKEVLNGLGYNFKKKLEANKSIIQLFYNIEDDEILKSRFISFVNIDSKLEELLKNDGMVVVN